jgi:ABC-type antimicrobial peptide transport system permease subunit
MRLQDAQELLGRQRQVSLFYIRLKDPALRDRFVERVERQWSDFSISGLQEFAEDQAMGDMLEAFVWAIGGLAIIIGGVGMMNAQLMAVMERTREIGVLRAIGWSSRRILWMILMESITVCLIGGLLGFSLGYLLIVGLAESTIIMGLNTSNISTDLIIQAFSVVIILGLIGGLYPAWRASRLQPVEALRYEGGSSGSRLRRLPIGGMAVQSLWQRSTRTLLTISAIGLTVGAIMAIEGVVNGLSAQMTDVYSEIGVEIMLRQADISDTSLSVIDDRVGARIAAMPEVESASGVILTGLMLPEQGSFFILMGYPPNDFAIRRYRIVEGSPLKSNHQIILGRTMADALNKKPGSTLELSGSRYIITGIYESKIGWEEMGGVVTLRDAQTFTGKPRQSTMYAVKLKDPSQAEQIVDKINREFPGIHAALASDFVSQMPDMQNSNSMVGSISMLAVLVGGIGVLNTMLMSVFERTREIGVLRSMGWRRRRILGLIMREATILGILGGIAGILLALLLVYLMQSSPSIGGFIEPIWSLQIFTRAILVALLLGLIGGLYPAFRATRLQPIEALRYE